MERSCRLLHGQPRQPFEWNYFLLLRMVLTNKKRNLRKYSVVFFKSIFQKKKLFGKPCIYIYFFFLFLLLINILFIFIIFFFTFIIIKSFLHTYLLYAIKKKKKIENQQVSSKHLRFLFQTNHVKTGSSFLGIVKKKKCENKLLWVFLMIS